MKYKFKNINVYKEMDYIPIEQETICFHGKILDDRGGKALSLNKDNECISFNYDDEYFCIYINEKKFTIHEYVHEFIKISKKNIIIESTTLSIVETLFILKALKSVPLVKTIQILYIEPKEYKFKNNSILEYDDFDLSSRTKEFPPIPGFTMLTKQKEDGDSETIELIAFLGFEKKRLGQIFNAEDAGVYNSFTAVIPLPGFKPGWENITLSSHLKFFTPKYFFTRLEYVSANNPYHAYKILEDFSKTRTKFRIAPIGTTPNAIGCAIFLLNNEVNQSIESDMLFDFPVNIKKRSTGIGKINIYTLYKS